MTVTVAEATTKLAQIIAQTEAGEEIIIGRDPNHTAVKLAPLASGRARLTRRLDLIGSTVTHNLATLVQPLPPEEWGELAGRVRTCGARVGG